MDRYRLTVDIDHDSPVPVYEQIAAHIRADITAGKLRPKQRVPSIEQIRQDTGCAVMTIRNGIKLLAKAGYLIGLGGTIGETSP